MTSVTNSLPHATPRLGKPTAFYAANSAAQLIDCDRRRLRRELAPSATLVMASGKTHPLYSAADLAAYAAKVSKAVA